MRLRAAGLTRSCEFTDTRQPARHHAAACWAARFLPIHSATGAVTASPSAAYRLESGVPPSCVHPSGNPWRRSHSVGVSRRTDASDVT